jgi:Rhodopirellula transposase DDE domain
VRALRRARRGPGPRLPRSRGPQGRPVRDLRHRQQRGLRIRRSGRSAETAQFAVQSIRAWWKHLGQERFPDANTLTLTADCGGGNSPRVHLWKVELQRLANDTGLEIQACHFPPGTSKWNKVEHRLFSFISVNWRGRPLTSYQIIIDLISQTTTSTGLKVYDRLDPTVYPKKIKVTKQQIAAVNITGHEWHPEWNYRISPNDRHHDRTTVVDPRALSIACRLSLVACRSC